MVEYAWLIAALPLTAAVLQAFFGRRLGETGGPLIGIVAMAGTFVIALIGLFEAIGGAAAHVQIPWFSVGELDIPLGFQYGNLEAAVIVMIAFVSLMVQIYSIGYMHGDPKYNRFFTVVSLFTFGMLVTVLGENLVLLLIGWEVMSFCSFALIGHWFENRDNARAAMKAFLTTGVANLGLMAGTFLLITQAGTASFTELNAWVSGGQVGVGILTLAALLLFWGAMGKSAQVPLHAWLPDAMAGPTPGSALIHAATMVAAGVFLVARTFFIFAEAPGALFVVALVGGITAFVAATIATVQDDIKKVLAYSTVSQLGYMMLALGVFGYTAAIFHLITHGFFKALLFLGAGSVIHAVHHEQDMKKMGGLLKKLPWTGITFIIGSLALAGIWPFAGFYSKDEILLDVFNSPYRSLFWLGAATALMTAYYMARTVILTFFGKPRDRHVYEHAHESPQTMTLPLVMLAIPSALIGLVGAPMLGAPIQDFIIFGQPHLLEGKQFVLAVATASAVLGLIIGYLIYGRGLLDREQIKRTFRPVYVLLTEKYYFDHLYHGVVAAGVVLISRLAALFDNYVVDGIVN
ncbi:MAG: NADH-quinone oxidoreductase subunit L, partial [Thermaerobacterales bacterium]